MIKRRFAFTRLDQTILDVNNNDGRVRADIEWSMRLIFARKQKEKKWTNLMMIERKNDNDDLT